MPQWRTMPVETTQRHSPNSQHGRSTGQARLHVLPTISSVSCSRASTNSWLQDSQPRTQNWVWWLHEMLGPFWDQAPTQTLQRVLQGFRKLRPPRAPLSKEIVGEVVAILAASSQHSRTIVVTLIPLTYCRPGEICTVQVRRILQIRWSTARSWCHHNMSTPTHLRNGSARRGQWKPCFSTSHHQRHFGYSDRRTQSGDPIFLD